MKAFTIDKMEWHLRVKDNPESRDHMVSRFWAVVSFLQENHLTVGTLAASRNEIGDDFSLSSSDLTEHGLELMRRTYDKWLGKVDKGMSPADTSIFEKELRKLC